MPNIRLPMNQPTAKLVATRATAIFVPWKRQPDFTITQITKINNVICVYKDIEPFSKPEVIIKFPCQQGDTVYLLETWGYGMHGEYVYKASKGRFKSWVIAVPLQPCQTKLAGMYGL